MLNPANRTNMFVYQVKIKLLDSAPMQIDGEPWEQHPAEISLTHHAQVQLNLDF